MEKKKKKKKRSSLPHAIFYRFSIVYARSSILIFILFLFYISDYLPVYIIYDNNICVTFFPPPPRKRGRARRGEGEEDFIKLKKINIYIYYSYMFTMYSPNFIFTFRSVLLQQYNRCRAFLFFFLLLFFYIKFFKS